MSAENRADLSAKHKCLDRFREVHWLRVYVVGHWGEGVLLMGGAGVELISQLHQRRANPWDLVGFPLCGL